MTAPPKKVEIKDKSAKKPARTARSADVSQRVYEMLRARAIDYTLRPGDKIKELELANELGVSRTPIREALSRLVSEGMIGFKPNRGFFRTPLDISEIVNLYEVRAAIEIAAAQAACVRASDRDIDRVAKDSTNLTSKKNIWATPIADILKADEAFHESLVALSGNEEFSRIIKSINARIRFVRAISIERIRDSMSAGASKPTVSGDLSHHDAVTAALRERNADACARILRQHILLNLDEAIVLLKEGLSRIYLGSVA